MDLGSVCWIFQAAESQKASSSRDPRLMDKKFVPHVHMQTQCTHTHMHTQCTHACVRQSEGILPGEMFRTWPGPPPALGAQLSPLFCPRKLRPQKGPPKANQHRFGFFSLRGCCGVNKIRDLVHGAGCWPQPVPARPLGQREVRGEWRWPARPEPVPVMGGAPEQE